MTKRKTYLKLADGGIIPPRPVSPFSLKGIAGSVGGVYDAARSGTTNAIETVARTFTPPPGYTPALATAAPAPVAAPVVASPAPLALGGMNLGVIQQREAAAGLRDGIAFLHGPGGPTDDKIDAKLSHGEAVLPADTVQHIGPENVQALIDATHTLVKGKGLRHYANGFPGVEMSETPFTESDARLFGKRPPGPLPNPQPQVPGMEVRYPQGPAPAAVPEPTIPGMDAQTRPMARGEERMFVRDPGPGNPNVGRTATPQPVTPQAPVTVTAAEPAPLAKTGLRGMVGAADTGVGQAFKNVGGSVARGVGSALRGGAAFAAPIAAYNGFNTDTEQYAKRFGMENTEPGFGRDLGVRALGLASDVGDALTMGQASRLFRDKQDVTDVQPKPARAAAPVTSAANPTDQRLAAGTQTAPPEAPGNVPGAPGVKRLGNSFSNTGEFLPTGGAGPSQANIAAADAIANRQRGQGLRGGMPEANLPAGYGTTIPGANAPASQYETELATRNASVRSTTADAGLSARQKVQRDQEQARIAQTGAVNAMHDATTRRGQDVSAASATEGHRVSLRGQDLSYDSTTRGQDMTSRTAANAARLDQMNKDRQYGLDAQKFGHDVAKTNFEQRERAQKDTHEEITNMIPNGPDGKPDTQTAARYTAGLGAALSNYQSALEKKAAAGDKGAASELERVQQKGLAALDSKDKRAFINGMKAKDLAEQSHTGPLNPVGGTAVISDEPITSLRKTGNGFLGFGGEYTSNRGDKIPARTIEKDGSFFGGQRRIDLRDLVRQ